MRKSIILLVVAVLASAFSVSAQGRRGLRLNEVMVVNDSNLVDDYGARSAWIELYNSTFAPLEISSVYLTTDRNNPKMYPVPLGDVNTEIPSRQHVVFFADGKPSRGTFHTNLQLVPGQENWIGIYDADGLTLIDQITIPANLPANASFARKVDGEGEGADAWEVRDGLTPDSYITPSSNNIIKAENPKIIRFSEEDKNGFGLTIMAMCIVFTALLVLCICFYFISKFAEKRSKQRKLAAHGIEMRQVPRAERPASGDSGEEIAAIVMALHEHLNAHDQESTVLTINKVRRAYSPWSSKIYNLREVPQRPMPRRR